MLTTNYIKMISLLETEKSKSLRFWALNFSNELFEKFFSNVTAETTAFMQAMSNYNVEESYLLICLELLESASIELSSSMLSILCNEPSEMTYKIAHKVLTTKMQEFRVKALVDLAKLPISEVIKDLGLSAICESPTAKGTELIIAILSAKRSMPYPMYEYYLGKIKNSGSDKEAEDIYIEYQNYLTSLDNFEADLNSLSSIDLIKAIESCPDLLDRECDRTYIELAILRSRRRKEE